MYSPARDDEITGLVRYLDEQLDALRAAAVGLTEERIRTRPGRSAFSIGGLLKHVTYGMRGALERFANGSVPAVDEAGYAAYMASFALAHDETGIGALAEFDEVRDAFSRRSRVRSSAPTTEPPSPWFGVYDARPANIRYYLVHQIEEMARHAGHADIIREDSTGWRFQRSCSVRLAHRPTTSSSRTARARQHRRQVIEGGAPLPRLRRTRCAIQDPANSDARGSRSWPGSSGTAYGPLSRVPGGEELLSRNAAPGTCPRRRDWTIETRPASGGGRRGRGHRGSSTTPRRPRRSRRGGRPASLSVRHAGPSGEGLRHARPRTLPASRGRILELWTPPDPGCDGHIDDVVDSLDDSASTTQTEPLVGYVADTPNPT